MRNPVQKMYTDAKLRAAKRGFDFNIDIADIQIPEQCPILGLTLMHNKGHSKSNSPSIDRLDNTKGYVKGNVWVISTLANNMKNSAGFKDLHIFADWVKANIPLDKPGAIP